VRQGPLLQLQAAYFGPTPEFRLNLHARYDLKLVERDVWPQVEKRIRPLQNAARIMARRNAGTPVGART
jgi:plasmid maintenance system antidote protein VapI